MSVYSTLNSFRLISTYIKRVLKGKNATVVEAVASVERFVGALRRILEDNSYQQLIFIPMYINSATGSFAGDGNNHWVSLLINIDAYGQILAVRYIDPMGEKLSDKIKKLVKEYLIVDPDFKFKENFSEDFNQNNNLLSAPDNNDGKILVYVLWNILHNREMPNFKNVTLEQFQQIRRENLSSNSLDKISREVLEASSLELIEERKKQISKGNAADAKKNEDHKASTTSHSSLPSTSTQEQPRIDHNKQQRADQKARLMKSGISEDKADKMVEESFKSSSSLSVPVPKSDGE